MKKITTYVESCGECPSCTAESGIPICIETGDFISRDGSIPENCPLGDADVQVAWARCTTTEPEKLERAKEAAHSALNAAEKAWHEYAALCGVGAERTHAFEVFENIRMARAV